VEHKARGEWIRTNHSSYYLAFSLAIVATIFDAVASWYSVAYLGLASEANGIWVWISFYLGFDGAMFVRVIWGMVMICVIAWLCHMASTRRQWRLTFTGLWICAGSLTLLGLYHVVGTLSVLG
jgi:hypothetical protein